MLEIQSKGPSIQNMSPTYTAGPSVVMNSSSHSKGFVNASTGQYSVPRMQETSSSAMKVNVSDSNVQSNVNTINATLTKNVSSNINSNLKGLAVNANGGGGAVLGGNAPPIPEPDYSLSESDGEDENSILVARNTKLNEKIALIDVNENSTNNRYV